MEHYNWIIEPDALDEYKDSILWYKDRSIVAAEHFIAEITQKLYEICNKPTSYRKVKKNYREALVGKYPFSIIYVVDATNSLVIVVSIFHHRRNPKGKFKGR